MKLAIFGYGGHAREVAAQINRPVDFFVDHEYSNQNIHSIKYFDPEIYLIMIAVSDPKLRKNIVNKLPKNTQYFNFIHPSAQILGKNVKLGEGSFVGANCILTTDIKIGDHSILNRAVQIGHDCQIGNYFSAMPGSVVSGNVKIGNNVYLGSNAVIKENIKICDDVILGLNSGVIKNISETGIYVGCPAKLIEK